MLIQPSRNPALVSKGLCMAEPRFRKAITAIDNANAADPNLIHIDGGERPKELAHAERVSRWLEKLTPDASEELKLAGRAHHIERWILPRNQYPDGRDGYLDWRRKLQHHHAQRAGEILKAAGYPEDSIQRVQDILQKKRLRRDPEVQAFEDALCLVFLETQLHDIASRLTTEKTVDVLRLTLPKMSAQGREAAMGIELALEDKQLLEQAVRGSD